MKSKIFKFLTIFIFIFSYLSCKLDIIQSPSMDSIISSTKSNNDDSIKPPQSLTASHGLYRQIELSWTASDNAVQYHIFSALSPYDTFEQIAETKGNATSISITEASGISKYYLVKALDSKGNLSSASKIIFASTLATPVITEIQENEDGTSVYLEWWMSNCDTSTYSKNIKYEIHCYNQDKTTEAVPPVSITSDTTNTTIYGLEPRTLYYYEVHAFLATNQDKSEISDKIDAQTAHLLIPQKIEKLSVEKGLSKSSIKLSFEIPDFVDYKVSSNVFERHPLYFSIERKLSSESDTNYKTIVNYLGTVKADDSDQTDTNINFSCKTQSSSSSNLTVEIQETDETLLNEIYPDYIPYSIITYTDTDVQTDKIYTYRIKSYTDDSTTIISSKNSFEEESGWLISNPQLDAQATYNSLNEDEFESIEVKLTPAFEDFGQTGLYTYVITQQHGAFKSNNEQDPNKPTEWDDEELILSTESLISIKNANLLFDFQAANIPAQGYYKYKLYIMKIGEKDFTDSQKVYTEYTAKTIITITSDAHMLPKISNFDVDDGYKDKYILKWNFQPNCTYKIQYVQINQDGSEGDLFTEELTSDQAQALVHDDFVIFEQPALCNESRIYTLTADSGLQASRTIPEIKQTLGLPELTMQKASYDSITVSWPKVSKASEAFSISAKYDSDSQTELVITQEENQNTQITFDEEKQLYVCKISNPKDFDDAQKSGFDITFTVTATSQNHELEQVTSTIKVYTLGPAKIEPKINQKDINTSSIILNWNNIKDADGYIIQRIKYQDGRATLAATQTDKYYYDCDKKTLSLNGETVPKENAEVIEENPQTLKLIDKYSVQKDETSSYQSNQAQIEWGLPFGYIIIPVSKNESASEPQDDFIFDSTDVTTLDSSSKIEYKNLYVALGATKGFGLEVKANKSESAYTQNISWTLPYYSDFTPTLYRRPANSTENIWTKVSTSLKKNDTSVNYNPSKEDQYKAFEYIISYSSNSETISIPESLLNYYKTQIDDTRYDFKNYKKESINKGYLLNIPFRASYNGTINSDGSYIKDNDFYSERVEWSPWDYENRSIGPDRAVVSIYNKNLSSGWQSFANLDQNCYCTSTNSLEDTNIRKNSDLESTQIILSPEKISNKEANTTTGPLMILRDAYHYYKIELTKGNTSHSIGSILDSSKQNYDAIFAYRQITDEELSKAIMLIIADAFNQTSEGNTLNGNTGKFHWEDNYNIAVWRELKLQIDNYNHKWSSSNIPSLDAINSFITLSHPNTNLGIRGRTSYKRALIGTDKSIDSNNCPYYLNMDAGNKFDSSKLIPVEITSSIPLDSYKVTFNFATDNKDLNILITHKDNSADFKKQISGNDFKYWNPMRLDTDDANAYLGKNKTYGWWN